MSSEAPFRLVLFGQFSLTGPHGPIDLGNRKLCALLAYLACAAQPQSRETLTTLLWGSHFEAQARQNLRQALSRLRRALAEDLVVSTDSTVSLRHEMCHCDAATFERLVRQGTRDSLASAVDLYRGTFLANIAIPQDAWTEWVNGQRHRLESMAVDSLIRLGEEEQTRGDPVRALELARRAIGIDGLREDGHRLVIGALASIGRRAEALKQYETLASLLKRELGVGPDAATESLVAGLRKPPAPPDIAPGAPQGAIGGAIQIRPEPAAPARPQAATGGDVPQAPPAERRQVCVLFCDLVGSTALSERVDPEELVGIIGRYQRAASEVIREFGGHVARFLGDGVMAWFGWPAAREDDAEQALRAGLRLIETIAKMPSSGSDRLLARVGIASGLVVIGGASPEAGDAGIAGLTPNIAYRLQSEAEPNMLVVTPLTARLAGKAFQYRSLGRRTIKGISEPLEVLQVLGSGAGQSRFEARRGRSDAPLTGRAAEIELLLSRWRLACRSEGQAVLLSGDAGIGKSRLVHAVSQHIKPDGLVLRLQCSPLHQDVALYPVIEHVQRAAGLRNDDSAGQKIAKLEVTLRQTGVEPTEHLPLQCHLLQIDSAAHRLPDLTPQQLRERLVSALWAQLRGLAGPGPVMLIVEDAQWIDPTTEDLLQRALAGLEHLPMMIVATSRDAFPRPWLVHGHVTTLSLSRLSATDSRQLIHAIAGDDLPADVQGDISARAEGVPLYLEELTLSLLEHGNRSRAGDYPHIPATLQGLLSTRLDQLGDAKPLVQAGAVLGREFTPADLRAVSGCTPAELEAAVRQSLASGLLHQHGTGDGAPLVFKHALVHDAAYAGLLNSEKKRLHRAVVQYLESQPASADSAGRARLASHAERGEAWDRAARHLVTACTHAIKASANREAIALFDRALRALAHLPVRDAAPLAIDVRLHAFSAFLALGEIDRLVEVLREAETLARELGDRRRLAAAASQLANALWLAGEHHAGLRTIDEAERLAGELGDLVLRLSSRFNHANLLQATGQIREAAMMHASILDDLPGELEFKRFGWPGLPSVLARCMEGWSLVLLGDFTRARQTVQRAHEVAQQAGQPYSIVYTHLASGLYHEALGDTAASIAAFEAAHAVNRQVEMVLPIALAWLGAAYAQGGRAGEALPLLLDAERNGTYRSGGKYNWVHHYIALARTHLALNNLPAARAAIGQARGICEATGERAHLALSLKLQGDIEAADSASRRAAADTYQQAMVLADQCGLRPLLAHCHAALGDLPGEPDAATHHAAADTLFAELGIRKPAAAANLRR